jgi:hypothetical protein
MHPKEGVTSVAVVSCAGFRRPERPQAPVVPRPRVIQLGDQILVFRSRDGRFDDRCVAQSNQKGHRCSAAMGHPEDQVCWREDWVVPGTGGVIRAAAGDGAWEQCYIQQRCHKHVDRDEPNADAPVWELFDPVIHADLIEYRPVPTWTPEGLKYVTSGETPLSRSAARRGREETSELIRAAAGTRVEPTVVTALYSYYDADDRLLYVGITDHLATRQSAHVKSSSWMEFAGRSTIERFPTRKEAELAEQERIKTLRPLFNSVHNDDPNAARRLVEYLVERNRTDLLTPAVSRG